MSSRLALNSKQWESSASMRKAKKMLDSLHQLQQPTSKDIEDFIYEFEETDSFATAYYFALPYLTDLLLFHKESCFEAISDFCNPLMPANTIPPTSRAQIQLVREQIVALMIFSLEQVSSKNELDYHGSCRTYIAGIAAIYMEGYVARQIAFPD